MVTLTRADGAKTSNSVYASKIFKCHDFVWATCVEIDWLKRNSKLSVFPNINPGFNVACPFNLVLMKFCFYSTLLHGYHKDKFHTDQVPIVSENHRGRRPAVP